MLEIDESKEFDVIVIGGGPAGSSSACLLAKRGWRVLVLEKAKFPRYHIGESLLPGAVSPLMELGLFDRVEHIGGALRKYGGTLRWGADAGTWNFQFEAASRYPYTFQVRRADFDALLLARARELGATVIEEASVSAPLMEDDRVVGVTYTLRNAQQSRRVRARMVVDASGQSILFGRHFGLRSWNENFRNMATWAYFQDCERYEGTLQGDVISEHTNRGWFWNIPLSDGTNSVGFVSPADDSGKSRQELEDTYFAELGKTEEIGRLLRNAQQVSEFRTIKDWSYVCDRMYGDGWILTGDAAGFVDPLLSSGVTLALRGSRGVAEAVNAVLVHPESSKEVLDRYQQNYRSIIGQILSYVGYFYDTTRNKEDYWEKAQNIVDPERRRSRIQNFVSVMSGLNGIFISDDEKELYSDYSLEQALEYHLET
ncbi:NAD(P)/FAD-dependent oxidoreductase [Nocardia sp. CC201C]|uniref:NAD(P)/FAD-dependent oxidoreductase n=1 Tax=Nocardia sp. CC201C TaxID=3044575 RepID=UPI0024A8936A|nr:NAD(P)/FAD-dependent oxidoreductase [Nocardia sp. CC201C]